MSAINTNQQTNSTLKPRSSKAFILLTLLLCLVWITSLILVPKSKPTSAHSNLARLPLAFIPNYGQSASEGLFQVHDQYGSIFLTQSEMVLLSNQAGPVRIAYQGTQPTVSVQGRQGLPGKVNYIMGRNRLKGLPTYAEVDYQGLYPGVDLRYTGQNGVLESFYDLDAGVDPAIIRWKHSGAELARVDSSGSLLLYQAVSDPEPVLVEKAPSAWQEINGSRVTIPARYIANLDGSYGFSLEAYNPAYAITIDPTLVYGSYFGGSKMEQAGGIALDGQGNIYIAGDTFSTDFPQDGGVQTTSKGGDDAYILKLDPTGQTLLYATYLGGSGDDSATAISVDSAGKAAVVGDTDSTDFPTYHAYASAYKAFDDAFVVVLGPDGSQLLYGTYLGGSTWADSAEGVVLDESGAVYVTGTTYSSDFPLKHAVQSTLGGVQDAFVAKLDPTLNGADSLVYSTFLGGSAVEYGSAIALGAGGEAVVSGQTFSTDFPTKKPVQAALKGSGDAFIARLNAAGDGLVYSTYLGGSKEDKAYSVALSSKGIAYVTGTTASTDFPTLSAFQNANAGGDDAFITALKADGSAWLLSSYWGGASADSGYDLTLGPNDSLYVTGQTNSADFPTKNSLQAYMGDGDAFVTKFSAGNTTVDYSTYLGGGGAEYSGGIVTDGLSAAYITGATLSTNFPTKDPLYASAAGGGDVFIAKIDDKGDTPTPEINPLLGSYVTASQFTLKPGETLTITILLHNSGTEDVTADVVDKLPEGLDYKTGTASGGVYSSTKHTLTWTGVAVPSGEDISLTFDATTTVTTPTPAIDTATITQNGESIDRSVVILLGKPHLSQDITRPVVQSFTIGDADVLTDPDVVLHTQVTNPADAATMFLREWQINPTPFPHWQLVKSSGWVDFKADYPWTLGDQPGPHFVTVWVADSAKNISLWTRSSFDFASLLVSGSKVEQYGLVPYLVYYDKGVDVDAVLTSTSGDADLYVWKPGNFILPDHSSIHSGTDVDEVQFTTSESGIYIFLVYGYKASTYDLSITPGGGTSPASAVLPALTAHPNLIANAMSRDGLTHEPIFSVIGVDPFGVNGPGTPSTGAIYLPLVRR